MIKCSKWMTNCLQRSQLSSILILCNLLIIGILLITAITTIILLSNIFKKSPVKIDLNRNKFISSFLIISMVFRIFYWVQNYWDFEPNSFPSVIEIVFSLTSMLFMYLSQSVFVKSWLLNFQRKSSQQTQSTINRTFWIIDSVIVFILIVAIVFSIFDDQTVENGVFSQISSVIIVFSSFINSMSFLIIGSTISVKISAHLSCSRSVVTFLLTSIILTSAALFRCVTFLCYIFDKSLRQKVNLVEMLLFFIPEVIPTCVILGTQIQKYLNERRYLTQYKLETMALLEQKFV
ncbi:Hypothetical_protein [Hexamita inflata]|uniref:Hypothetical_protein n=1 Tax=Hexamita inflata TaxID=28002 RepID=A0AA86UTT0_9EUKA|nr:Hypothetical protein HINF_LOCUS52217 [Hexamita inflata]